MKTHYHLLKLVIIAPLAFSFGSLHGQDNDPFIKNDPKEGPKPPAANLALFTISEFLPQNIQVTFEAFSLPLSAAAKINRQKLSSADSYKTLIAMSEEGSAKQEIFESLTALPGQLATTEGIQEYIYPTEFDPSQGDPDTAEEGAPENKPLAPVPATPTAFDTRNVGFTFEVEAQIGASPQYIPLTQKGAALLLKRDRAEEAKSEADPFAPSQPASSNKHLEDLLNACNSKDLRKIRIIELRFTPTFIKQTGLTKWGQGPSEAEMPVFEVQSVKTGVTLVAEEPFFMGTFSPFREVKEAPEGEEKVWFAYVTASIKTAGL